MRVALYDKSRLLKIQQKKIYKGYDPQKSKYKKSSINS